MYFLGGSVIKILGNGLPKLQSDWSKWTIFFCDERHVPFDDPECTYSQYKTHLFSKLGFRDSLIFPDEPALDGAIELFCSSI